MSATAHAQLATDTSGFVTLATDQTITGGKTFSAQTSFTAPADGLIVRRDASGSLGPRLLINNQGASIAGSSSELAFKTSSSFIATYYSAAIQAVNGSMTEDQALIFRVYGLDGTPAGLEKFRLNSTGAKISQSLSFQVSVVAGGQTLALGSASRQVYTGAGNTWTLPAVSNTGLEFVIKNRGSGNLVIDGAGAEQIFSTAAVNDITLTPGASATLFSDGTFWNVA